MKLKVKLSYFFKSKPGLMFVSAVSSDNLSEVDKINVAKILTEMGSEIVMLRVSKVYEKIKRLDLLPDESAMRDVDQKPVDEKNQLDHDFRNCSYIDKDDVEHSYVSGYSVNPEGQVQIPAELIQMIGEGCSQLKAIEFFNIKFDDNSSKALAELIRNSQTLNGLLVQNCKIDENGFLFSGIRDNNTIKQLYLDLSDKDRDDTNKALTQQLCTALQSSSIVDLSFTGDSDRRNLSSVFDFYDIFESLPTLKALRKLVFIEHLATMRELTMLFDSVSLCLILEDLWVGSCTGYDDGDQLKCMRSFKRLLGDNNLAKLKAEDAGYISYGSLSIEFCQALAENKTLQCLSFRDDEIDMDDQAAQNFAKAVKSNNRLMELELGLTFKEHKEARKDYNKKDLSVTAHRWQYWIEGLTANRNIVSFRNTVSHKMIIEELDSKEESQINALVARNRRQWIDTASLSILLSFVKANRTHPFALSILPLVKFMMFYMLYLKEAGVYPLPSKQEEEQKMDLDIQLLCNPKRLGKWGNTVFFRQHLSSLPQAMQVVPAPADEKMDVDMAAVDASKKRKR